MIQASAGASQSWSYLLVKHWPPFVSEVPMISRCVHLVPPQHAHYSPVDYFFYHHPLIQMCFSVELKGLLLSKEQNKWFTSIRHPFRRHRSAFYREEEYEIIFGPNEENSNTVWMRKPFHVTVKWAYVSIANNIYWFTGTFTEKVETERWFQTWIPLGSRWIV